MRPAALFLAVFVALAGSSCGNSSPTEEGQTDNGSPNNGTPNNVTPNNGTPNNGTPNNVDDQAMMLPVPLQQTMDENCLSCHGPGGIGPHDFTDIETVVNLGELIASSVANGTMPPWNADPTCADLKGDLRLSDEQIALFTDWVEDGKPLVPEAPFERLEPKNPEIGDPPSPEDEQIDLVIEEPYDPVFGRSQLYQEDDFRCFVVDPGFENDRELTGFEVLVDNEQVAHHMVVFTADGDAENRAALADLEDDDPAPGFSCFGVSGFNVDSIAAVWAPGGGRVGLPKRQGIGQTAVPVDAGSVFVIQLHYNEAEANAGSDQSGVRMWFRPPEDEIHELAEGQWSFVGNEPFRIPAGVDGTGVPDDECDIVYNTYELDDDDTPISPPADGYHGEEVECGIELEDCEAQYGAGAEECAIDYSTRLRVSSMDPNAQYTVTIAGVDVTFDAAAAEVETSEDILGGLADAIAADETVSQLVTTTLRDRDSDGVNDEIIVSNLDDEPSIRTEAFLANSDEADVWHGQVDGCSTWDPDRIFEARRVGSSGCVQQEIYYRNPGPLKLWAAFSHMHLVGERIEIQMMSSDDDGEVSVPRTEASCLSRTNAWDFDWQRTYWFQEPLDVPRNGVVRLRCRYDNSDSGEEVRLGDGSGSEMCLGLLYLTL